MARRRFRMMRHSGVSIRLVPAALLADAAVKAGVINAVDRTMQGRPGEALAILGNNVTANAGGILADVIASLLFVKVFPRTPGLKFGRFRVSI